MSSDDGLPPAAVQTPPPPPPPPAEASLGRRHAVGSSRRLRRGRAPEPPGRGPQPWGPATQVVATYAASGRADRRDRGRAVALRWPDRCGRRGDDEQLVADLDPLAAARGERGGVADDQRDDGVGRQPQLADLDAGEPRPGGIRTCSRSAEILSSGAASTSTSRAAASSISPRRRATNGSVGACRQVKTTTNTSTTSNRNVPRRCPRPAESWPARSVRRPAVPPRTGRPARGPAILNQTEETQHRERSGHEGQEEPGGQRDQRGRGRDPARASRAGRA